MRNILNGLGRAARHRTLAMTDFQFSTTVWVASLLLFASLVAFYALGVGGPWASGAAILVVMAAVVGLAQGFAWRRGRALGPVRWLLLAALVVVGMGFPYKEPVFGTYEASMVAWMSVLLAFVLVDRQDRVTKRDS